jgi:hypothetical protein
MSSMNTDHFTGMDGNAIEDSPEPLPCPFCSSGGDQPIVERWSEEDGREASYHVQCLKCGSNGPQGAMLFEAAQGRTDDRGSGRPSDSHRSPAGRRGPNPSVAACPGC